MTLRDAHDMVQRNERGRSSCPEKKWPRRIASREPVHGLAALFLPPRTLPSGPRQRLWAHREGRKSESQFPANRYLVAADCVTDLTCEIWTARPLTLEEAHQVIFRAQSCA